MAIKTFKAFLSGPGLKWLINILISTSIIFLAVYLYKFDYLSLRGLHIAPFPLALSVIFIFIALILGAYGWWRALVTYGVDIDVATAIISHSRSVLAKYVPGTLWGVIGRAAWLSQKGYSLTDTSFVSTKLQVMNISTGLLIGIAPLVFIPELEEFRIPLILLLAGMAGVVVSVKLQDTVLRVAIRLFRQKIIIPAHQGDGLSKIYRLLFVQYFFYSLGMFFLVKSFYADVSPLAGLAFPLSVNFGVLVMIFPGGIGVREGAMSWFLNLVGVPLSIAVTISIVARLWSIAAELGLFIFGVWLEKSSSK